VIDVQHRGLRAFHQQRVAGCKFSIQQRGGVASQRPQHFGEGGLLSFYLRFVE
jgi:hypothetical protein